METAVTILSGGLDSAVSTAIAREEVHITHAITFDYGQRAVVRETAAAKKLCEGWQIHHQIIPLPFLANLGQSALTSKQSDLPSVTSDQLDKNISSDKERAQAVWVPNRNAIFVNIVAAIAEAENCQWIITGFNLEESATFPDNSPAFIDAINQTLTHCTLTGPQVRSYVSAMNKREIFRMALEKKIEVNKLWFCYEGGDRWCGICESCARTIRAMKELDIYNDYEKLFLK